MTDIAIEPPRAHARIVYLGPVSPHWEISDRIWRRRRDTERDLAVSVLVDTSRSTEGACGDRTVIDEFRARALARLVLLPRDDPQFRRNRERIVRDAERERISLEWDLGHGIES